jgi:hypothetical protein
MGLTKTFLALGIMIVFALFIGYGLFVIYEPPERLSLSDTNCQMNCSKFIPEKVNSTIRPIEFDEKYDECWKEQEDCMDEARVGSPRYNVLRNSFYILLLLSIGAILFGMFTKFEGIGSGFIGGGIILLLYSLIYTGEYWWTLSKYFKLIALGIVLFILIYFGFKKVEKRK